MKKYMHSVFYCFVVISRSVPLYAEVSIERGLSYHDVLLVPQQTDLVSRSQVCTKTRLTKNIVLNIPIVSSNMDSVTEAEMAIAMALHGGLGIIHRFNTIEEQVAEVKKVKRYRNAIIEQPLTIHQSATIAHAVRYMKKNNVSGLLVTDDEQKLVGIITARDVSLIPADDRLVSEIMTKKEHLVVAPSTISAHEAKNILIAHAIEKLPLIHEDWSIVGLITRKDIAKKTKYPLSVVDKNDRLIVGAAIGIQDDAFLRAEALVNAGVDILVIDVAHGHSTSVIEMICVIKEKFPSTDLIAGNVATTQGVRALIEAGADGIKVGIGPGSICTTRIATGCGYPQLSALINCAREADLYNIPIIADGGITCSGDITKAIAAGASTVMLGNLLAGTDESPGRPFYKNGKKYKVIRGMASFGANLSRNKKIPNDYIEGVEAFQPYKGTVIDILHQLMNGLRSGMSYCGVRTLDALRGNGHFVEITSQGVHESYPHDVQEVIR